MNFSRIIRICLALVLTTVIVLTISGCSGDNVEPKPTETEPPTTLISLPEDENNQTAFLGDGLYITDIGKYTGVYVEDGSDDLVTNVLMIVLKNKSDRALQLGRISLEYAEFTAQFEVTNLPSGQSVVLLEKNRHEYVSERYLRAKASNVAFFSEPMDLQESKIKLSGAKGAIVVENLTDEIMGEIYIYYKNSAVDLLYGGITYRARVDAGLKPGKDTTVMTNHYNPDTCTILNVQILPAE